MADKILMFTSVMCDPCAEMAVTMSSQDINVPVEKMDADNSDVLSTYVVRTVPLLIYLRDGEEVARLAGNRPLEKIISWIEGRQ